MRSWRSFVHLGFLTTAALAVSFAAAAPAYHVSARGGGVVTARNDVARNFTAAARRGRGRASTYQVTDKTRFVAGGAPGSWWGVGIGTVVRVRWHRAGSQRVADVVAIMGRPGN